MSVNIAECGAMMGGYNYLSREPYPYTKRVVVASNANGYPTHTDYYYGDQLVFIIIQTWNAQNQELTWEVLKP